jgi:lipoprotein NlpI
MRHRLTEAIAAVSIEQPPDSNCAGTLGAKRFSVLLDSLGEAYASLGDDRNAVDAFSRAISCSPRAAFLHAELAASLLNLGRYEEARTEMQRQLATNRPDFALHNLLVQLDFVADRWADAVVHARLAVVEAPDDEQAIYWQCYLWLAQEHQGIQTPELAPRHASENWPRPVLELLERRIAESDLVADIRSETDAHRRREILTEALFYTGERRLAAHDREGAERYFTATVNLQVPYFIEHHLAVAELEKLHHRQSDRS